MLLRKWFIHLLLTSVMCTPISMFANEKNVKTNQSLNSLLSDFPDVSDEAGDGASDNDDEESKTKWPASMVSGTLPVMFINTEDSQPILDKINQIPADLWIEIPENCETKDFELGSADEPVKLVIRGRGNSTWLAPKKPYKIKFNSKTEILGMPKHKHFALLAGNGGWGNFLSPTLGPEIARLLGMSWAPHFYPVELVLNGEYMGLYNLFESVKIDINRINIFEQEDLEEDDEIIPYGWLIEIDNYEDECQIIIEKEGCTLMRVTYHSPEVLSDKQLQWLTETFTEINDVINHTDISERERWAELIDAQSMAQMFIVRELLQDYDGFNGSTYLHRDKIENAKWVMGPIWDTASGVYSEVENWTKDVLPIWSTWKFIPEIFNTKSFSSSFKDEWNDFYENSYNDFLAHISDFSDLVKEASKVDSERWGHSQLGFTDNDIDIFKDRIAKKAKWIDDNKYYYVPTGMSSPSVMDNFVSKKYYDLSGAVTSAQHPGMYISVMKFEDGTTKVSKVVVR